MIEHIERFGLKKLEQILPAWLPLALMTCKAARCSRAQRSCTSLLEI